MSGLVGVRWLDDANPAFESHVAGPLQTLRHRGPDGLSCRAAGSCALGFARFVTTPEGHREQQPFVRGGLTVTFDGRLDNATELSAALSLDQSHTDVSVVAAAWERWGLDALDRLVGDFALATWDSSSRTLWLARDVFGLRPLFYRTYRDGFWWASELQTLARLGDAQVCEAVAGDYLADAVRSETETLVRGVMRVPRATVLELRPLAAPRTYRYWTPTITASARRRSDGETVEEFRVLFREAVQARLRSDRRVAISLSGGVDSGLVAAEAARLNYAPRPSVEAFTVSWPGPSDEAEHARAVTNHLMLPHTLCPAGQIALAPIVCDAARALDLPMPPNSVAAAPMNSALQCRGIRVCLSGIGGDEWFTGNRFAFADEIRRLDIADIARRIRDKRSGHAAWRDAALAVWIQLPAAARQRIRQFMPPVSLPAWIDPTFASRINLQDRLRTPLDMPVSGSFEQRVAFAWATHPDKVFTLEYAERLSTAAGCEERLPFMDRRLVEWALALPHDQRSRKGQNKVVLRNAARAVLPANTAARRFASECSHETVRGLRSLGGAAFLDDIARRRADWVNQARVADLWRSMESAGRRSEPTGYASWMLWLLVATHLAVDAIETCADRWADESWAASQADATIRQHAASEVQEIVA